MTSVRRGLFVTLDGPAGVGKTTTTKRLWNYLTVRGFSVHTTTEPSKTTLGNTARHNTDTYRGLTLACLVAADRYHHLETEVRPKVDGGFIVICDRYVASSYVLQRMDDVPLPFIEAINSAADLPDLAIILEAPASVTAARVAARGAHNWFHAGVGSSEQEADLCKETAARLMSRGYPVLSFDTSATGPAGVAEQLGTRIADMATDPSTKPATA